MNYPTVHSQPAKAVEPRPPAIFSEDNRLFWEIVRRFMINLIRALDRAYGWDTFKERR
jgi:hypothetical protein